MSSTVTLIAATIGSFAIGITIGVLIGRTHMLSKYRALERALADYINRRNR